MASHRLAWEFCVSRAKAMHEEHGVCALVVCDAIVHVGHRIVFVAVVFVLSGRLLASCVQNWQSTGWWGLVLCWGGHGQMVAALV